MYRLFFLFAIGFMPVASAAEVFYSQEEALALVFPKADEVEKKSYILSSKQLELAQKLARTKIDSKLFTFFAGKKEGKVIKYAAIDSNIVRTLPEAFMVVLSPEGKVLSTVILAFHEPSEYLPPESWLEQFVGSSTDDQLVPGRDISGILGSTLSVRAISKGVRKIQALHKILILENE